MSNKSKRIIGVIGAIIMIFGFPSLLHEYYCKIHLPNYAISNVKNEIEYNEFYGEPMTNDVIISRIYYQLNRNCSCTPKLETVNYCFEKIKENMN